jgi:transcriptional regulator with XRE-family HTH domain
MVDINFDNQDERYRRFNNAPEYTAEAIRRLRIESGLTQRELAQEIGVTTAAIQHWENEDSNGPSPPNAVKLQMVFDNSVQRACMFCDKNSVNRRIVKNGKTGTWLEGPLCQHHSEYMQRFERTGSTRIKKRGKTIRNILKEGIEKANRLSRLYQIQE